MDPDATNTPAQHEQDLLSTSLSHRPDMLLRNNRATDVNEAFSKINNKKTFIKHSLFQLE